MNSNDNLFCSQSILMRVDDIHLQSMNHNLTNTNTNINMVRGLTGSSGHNQSLYFLVPYENINAQNQRQQHQFQKEAIDKTSDTIYPIIERL